MFNRNKIKSLEAEIKEANNILDGLGIYNSYGDGTEISLAERIKIATNKPTTSQIQSVKEEVKQLELKPTQDYAQGKWEIVDESKIAQLLKDKVLHIIEDRELERIDDIKKNINIVVECFKKAIILFSTSLEGDEFADMSVEVYSDRLEFFIHNDEVYSAAARIREGEDKEQLYEMLKSIKGNIFTNVVIKTYEVPIYKMVATDKRMKFICYL